MSAEKMQIFSCTWKITNFNIFFNQKKDKFIPSAMFRIESFDDSKWTLNIYPKGLYEKNKENVVCRLRLGRCGEYFEKMPISFRTELLCPDGIILVSSETLTDIMQNSMISEPCGLIKIEELKQAMSNWPEDTLVLRCYLESGKDLMPLTLREISVIGCDVETKMYGQDASFTWSLEIANFEEWSTVREIKIGGFLIEVTLKLVNRDMKIYLFSNVEDEWENRFICKISLLDEKNVEEISTEDYHFFKNTSKMWHFPNFLFKRHLEKANCFLLNEVKLKFKISHTFSNKVGNYYHRNTSESINRDSTADKVLSPFLELLPKDVVMETKIDKDGVSCLTHDFHDMLINAKFSDVKLRTDDELLSAHKNILSARSPVFSAMFDQDMVESNTGIVDILDVEAVIMKSFLEYIYTGEVKEMNENIALSLLIVADKYQVLPLVKKCSVFLESSLSLNNACKVLSTADMVNQAHLKSTAEKFILNNPTNILSSLEWSQLIKLNITLATELLFKISKKVDDSASENFKV